MTGSERKRGTGRRGRPGGIAGFFQLEAATLFSFLNRGWSIVSTLGFIAIVVTRLSPELQGFYFTFISLLVLLQLADMGFGIVLTQFASHEWAELRFGAGGAVEGSERAQARLGSLVAIALRWYAVAAVMFFLLLGAGGHMFFSASSDAAGIDWQGPWWLLCVFAAACLLLVPVTGLLEGCQRVLTSQRNQFAANALATFAGWTVLLAGGDLYAIAVLFAVRAAIGHALNTRAALPILTLRRSADAAHRIPWRTEFWPLQWRIWTSWLAGFFVYQSFAPIAFQIEGAVAAGQVGVMVQAFQAVNQLASARLSVDQPRMGMLAARGDFGGLRDLVKKASRWNVFASLFLALMAVFLVWALKAYTPEIGARFGDLLTFSVFVAVAIPLQIGNVETAAVRFQKKEPFVAIAAVSAFLIVTGSVIVTGQVGASSMSWVFCGVTLGVLLPFVHWIYLDNMTGRDAKAA